MQISKKSPFLRATGEYFVWVLTTVCILFVLLAGAASIPNQRIREHMLESVQNLSETESLFFSSGEGDRRTEIHTYADATTLNIAYSLAEENLLWGCIMSPFYSDGMNQDKSMPELLEERIVTGAKADTVYDRYWHGMIILIKPLMVLFSLQQINWIFFFVLFGSITALTVILRKKLSCGWLLLLWGGAFLVQMPVVAFCLEYVPVFFITFFISIAMVLGEGNRKRLLNLCAVSGVCVAFFDFLTTETLAFVIPLALVYGIWEIKGSIRSLKEELKYLFWAGCRWVAAYGITYLIKWGLASIASGENRFAVAASQLAGRQGNVVHDFAADSVYTAQEAAKMLQQAGGNVLPQPLSAVIINIRLFLGLSGKITLEQLALWLALSTFILVVVIYLFRKPERFGAFPIVLFLLGAIPMVRMMVLHNHSIEHCFFVYRSLYGTVLCFGAIIITQIDWDFLRRRKKNERTGVKKQR